MPVRTFYHHNILSAPPDARVIILHDGLLCYGTCSIPGGKKGTAGQKWKRSRVLVMNHELYTLLV